MMIAAESTRRAIDRIFPLLPWSLTQLQNGLEARLLADLELGTRASFVNNIVMKEGDRRFTDPNDIVVSNANGLQHFVIPTAKIRVKRGDARFLNIANNRTKQTLEWTSGQLPLDEVDDPRNYLHLVYVPDPFWITIKRCGWGLYKGKTPVTWHEIDVDDWYEGGGAAIDPFAPEPLMRALKLKPGATPLPLEEIDGTS